MDAEKLQKAVAEELAAKRIGQSLQMYGGVFLGLNSLGRTKWIKRKEPPGAIACRPVRTRRQRCQSATLRIAPCGFDVSPFALKLRRVGRKSAPVCLSEGRRHIR